MRHACILIASVAFGCGKELNPEFCDAHPADDRCMGGTTGTDAPGSADDATPDTAMLVCPSSYDQTVAGSSSRYRRVNSNDDWLSAAQICANDATGGANTHLAVLSTEAEWMALTAALDTPGRWVGHSDRITPDTFLAVTDEPNVYPALVMGDSPPWGTGGTTGDCGVMAAPSATGMLYPRACSDDAPFLCECDAYPNDATNY